MRKQTTYTPDGRYVVVRGRLWRASNPDLPEDRRSDLVFDLMKARRAMRGTAAGSEQRQAAKAAIKAAKQGLCERGPVWWTDGAPDYNRHLVKNTPYAGWFRDLRCRERSRVRNVLRTVSDIEPACANDRSTWHNGGNVMQRDEWISNRAYAIWEESGHPHGNDQAHWEQAEREWAHRGEDQTNASTSPANWDEEEA